MDKKSCRRRVGGSDKSLVWKAGAMVLLWCLVAHTVTVLALVPEPNALLFGINLVAIIALLFGALVGSMRLARGRNR